VEATVDRNDVVLIVDDDESVREALEMALQLDNHQTAMAADGVAALAWLQDHPPPCLILLDLMMPVMDGWQVQARLQKDARLAGVPVVIITAFDRDLGSAAQLPLLRKPIELDDLLNVVASHGCAGA
jgi:CheY-like chemotaxis protein